MLRKIIAQTGINFQPGTLRATAKYYERYERISEILDENPKILDLVHREGLGVLQQRRTTLKDLV